MCSAGLRPSTASCIPSPAGVHEYPLKMTTSKHLRQSWYPAGCSILPLPAEKWTDSFWWSNSGCRRSNSESDLSVFHNASPTTDQQKTDLDIICFWTPIPKPRFNVWPLLCSSFRATREEDEIQKLGANVASLVSKAGPLSL